jgi:hypothetical protein
LADDFGDGEVLADVATGPVGVNGFSPPVAGCVTEAMTATQIRGSVKDRLFVTGAWRRSMNTIP